MIYFSYTNYKVFIVPLQGVQWVEPQVYINLRAICLVEDWQ